MSNLILPDDPNFNKPVVMGDGYSKTPQAASRLRAEELDRQREQERPGAFKYATTQVAHAPDPWYKQAQAAGVSNVMTQPMWFSPLHTPQNWQIASKRREVYQWNRFWYENEPKVAAAIDFYARFPMNGFKLECPDRKILSFFEHHVVKKLKLNERMKEISAEYYMLGDVFVHTDIDCPICGGSAIDPDTKEVCNHEGGRFKRIFVMNPDWIEVQKSPLTDESLIVLIPDEELQTIVHKRQPKAIYDRIPEPLKPLILAKAPIPLSSRTISHLRHMPTPYGTYGTSIIRRLFTTLAYKTKIMTANWIVAERLILPVRVVKIGSDDRPASTTDIADVQQQLAATANDPNLTIVTHHNFEYEWYGCVSSCPTSSYVITARGKVHHNELTKDDLIATWNAQTEKIEYQSYIRNIEFDYSEQNSSGMAYRVGNKSSHNGWSVVCTPNHRHYLSNGKIKRSDELKIGDEIVNASQWGWKGHIPTKLPYKDWQGFENFSLEEFCEFAGYFVSEGHIKHERSKNLREEVQGQAFGMSQNEGSECYDAMKGLMSKISSKMYVHSDDRRMISTHTFIIANASLSRTIEDSFGSGSTQKRIPSWMGNLPSHYLRIILDAMMLGDGNTKGTLSRYSTVSHSLKDQLCNMLIKLGFSSYERLEDPQIENRNKIHRIFWSSHIKPRKFKINVLEEVPYDGKMWCLEMSNKNFFIEIDGHIFLTGNTQGKVLQITQEMEHIDKELLDGLMLNQALLNGEAPGYMCHDDQTQVLTLNGLMKFGDLDEDDLVACVDPDTGKLQYCEYQKKHEYDFDGELIHFETNRIDVAVTENHRMLFQKRDHDEWVIDEAKNVSNRAKFRKKVNWLGTMDGTHWVEEDGNPMFVHEDLDRSIPMSDYLKIVIYYVTEGHVQKESRKERSTFREPVALRIAQTPKGKGWDELCELKTECTTYNIKETKLGFNIYNKVLAKHLINVCGELSEWKFIPEYIKNLPVQYLEEVLMYLINGDGVRRSKGENKNHKYYTYYTKSKMLRDDVVEIALKCGYTPRFSYRRIWEISFSDHDRVKDTFSLESKKHDNVITKMPYKGKVWCLTVPTGVFITERNGKIGIHGNSAQVGVETLIRRIESWRGTLAEWCQEKIFKPIAEMQGFIDEEKSEEVGETVFLYPTIKWNDLELKDQSQFHQMLMQLHDKQVISSQTLLEEMGLNYDQEVKRMRYEQAQLGPAGAQLGGEQAGGGMPGMGGGAGGAAGAEGDMGMGMGEGAGMPGMGMGPAGGGMDMGGGGMGGGGMGGAAAGGDGGGKITKKGKGDKQQEEDIVPMLPIKLTKIEQQMAGMLEELANTIGFAPGEIRMQFPVENPTGGKSYSMDFAIPTLKIDIEADGEVWHSSEEQTSDDTKRDYLLAQRGWTVLRFDDKSIEDSAQQVQATIDSYIRKSMGSGAKTAASRKGGGNGNGLAVANYFVGFGGRLKDFHSDGTKYYKYLKRAYTTRNDMFTSEEIK